MKTTALPLQPVPLAELATPQPNPAPNPEPSLIATTRPAQPVALALFIAGFAGFSLLYAIQPLLPQLAAEFQQSAANTSWLLSISMLTLVLSMLGNSLLSTIISQERLIMFAVTATAVATLGCGLSQSFYQLLGMRALLGLALGGLPALALTYLHQSTDPAQRGKNAGLYIAGTALGGMTGRLVAASLTEWMTWRHTLGLLGLAALIAAWLFYCALPTQTLATQGKSQEPRIKINSVLAQVRQQIIQSRLLLLFFIAFVLAGSFASLYNYIAFYLQASHFQLSRLGIAQLSWFYLFGVGSALWGGLLLQRFKLALLLQLALMLMLIGLLLTLSQQLMLLLPGIALFTGGFFAAHLVCSAWLARLVQSVKALLTAIYLTCYYLGTALLGTASGELWQLAGWQGLVWLLLLFLSLALLTSYWLPTVAVENVDAGAQPVRAET